MPLDLNTPSRVDTILTDAKTRVILTDTDHIPEQTRDVAHQNKTKIVNISHIIRHPSSELVIGPELSSISAQDMLAYVLYTSGSTGKVPPCF